MTIPTDIIGKAEKIATMAPAGSLGAIGYGMYHERIRCAELVGKLKAMDEIDRAALISAIMEPGVKPMDLMQWGMEGEE